MKDQETLNWDKNNYLNLLNLKIHASKAAASFSQLNCLFKRSLVKKDDLDKLEKNILEAVRAILRNEDISDRKDYISNSFALIKSAMMEENVLDKSASICNLITKSIYSALFLASVCIAAMMICTGPIGISLLGIGSALISTCLLLLAAYSLYVDGRYLAGKQVEEIDTFIDKLFSYNCGALNILEESQSPEESNIVAYV
ncbi:MAG: hypothetical protein H0U57_10715 [Tatlockia sp.]|nr:hypothetical protein [Tatlockia sp.]